VRELLSGLVLFALFAGASLFAVDVIGDRETVVPPPDAVAEQFVRAVGAKRWEPSRAYLQDPRALSDEVLEAMQKDVGEGQNIEAEVVTRDDERAVVTVRVPSRNLVKNFTLTFDQEWKIVTAR